MEGASHGALAGAILVAKIVYLVWLVVFSALEHFIFGMAGNNMAACLWYNVPIQAIHTGLCWQSVTRFKDYQLSSDKSLETGEGTGNTFQTNVSLTNVKRSIEMNDSHFLHPKTPMYIETPRTSCRPVRIDAILEKRMKEFLLARRRQKWLTEGE